jgi:hypothetical protein
MAPSSDDQSAVRRTNVCRSADSSELDTRPAGINGSHRVVRTLIPAEWATALSHWISPCNGKQCSARPRIVGKLRSALVVVVAVLLVGCSEASQEHRPPIGVSGCNHMFTIGDAGAGVGLDWDTDTHPYGHLVFLYVCQAWQSGGTVIARAPSHVSITPARAEVNTAALLQFNVIVGRGVHGGLHFTFVGISAEGAGRGPGLPQIVAERDGWHFAECHC